MPQDSETQEPTSDRVREGARKVVREGTGESALWWVVAMLGVGMLLARLLAGSGWALDMIANVSPQIAVLGGVIGVFMLVMRKWVPAGVVLAASLVQWGLMFPGRAPSGAETDLSVMTFNVLGTNQRFSDIEDAIVGSQADVVVLLECSFDLSEWVGDSSRLEAIYPYRSLQEHDNQWAIVKLSRYPMVLLERRDERWQELRFNYVYRRTHIVSAPTGDAVIAAVLPASPRSPSRWAQGNESLTRDLGILEESTAGLGLPVLVACDLNASPAGVRTKIAGSFGLRRSKPFTGVWGTWPAAAPGVFRVAIDDVLVSEGCRVSSWRTPMEQTGSDHLPVIVGIEWGE